MTGDNIMPSAIELKTALRTVCNAAESWANYLEDYGCSDADSELQQIDASLVRVRDLLT
ncbi:MAG: hypothetical protein NVS9B15_04800 [Acidobacteriaceae bacterium]